MNQTGAEGFNTGMKMVLDFKFPYHHWSKICKRVEGRWELDESWTSCMEKHRAKANEMMEKQQRGVREYDLTSDTFQINLSM